MGGREKGGRKERASARARAREREREREKEWESEERDADAEGGVCASSITQRPAPAPRRADRTTRRILDQHQACASARTTATIAQAAAPLSSAEAYTSRCSRGGGSPAAAQTNGRTSHPQSTTRSCCPSLCPPRRCSLLLLLLPLSVDVPATSSPRTLRPTPSISHSTQLRELLTNF